MNTSQPGRTTRAITTTSTNTAKTNTTNTTNTAKTATAAVSTAAISTTPLRLASTSDLRQRGHSKRSIAAEVEAGDLVRIRTGWYANGSAWEGVAPQTRHLAAIRAAHLASIARTSTGTSTGAGTRTSTSTNTNTGPVFSHRSAATLHGLPVWSKWLAKVFPDPRRQAAPDPKTVHVVHATRHGRPREWLVRHRSTLSPPDRCTAVIKPHGELECTSATRTIIDLARTEPFGIALACTDAYLRREFRVRRRVDLASWHRWRERLLAQLHEAPRQRGAVAIRCLTLLADPRSDSVLETVSRLRFIQLGIDVELQTCIPSENGGELYLDFLLVGHNIFGECDGKIKYTDESLRGKLSPEEVVYAEKRRHDWITGSTGMRGIRWGASDVETLEKFRTRLRSFGIEPPRRPRPPAHTLESLC